MNLLTLYDYIMQPSFEIVQVSAAIGRRPCLIASNILL